jgi:hypothetical protein
MFRTPIRLLVLLAVSFTAIALAVPAQAAAPYCGITWGSLAKQGPDWNAPAAGQTLANVRAGRHDCYDRLVFDVYGAAPRSWHAAYVSTVTADPRGNTVPLRGGAFLEVVVGVSDHQATNQVTYAPGNPQELVNVTGFSTFRQVAWAGSFEGLTSTGLGVRARLPFRVFTLSDGGTSRVVVDVAHRW